jgi:hypothetical protein
MMTANATPDVSIAQERKWVRSIPSAAAMLYPETPPVAIASMQLMMFDVIIIDNPIVSTMMGEGIQLSEIEL